MRVETATERQTDGVGGLAHKDHPLPPPTGVGNRDHREQRPRMGMPRIAQQRLSRTNLHDPTQVSHRYTVVQYAAVARS
jgi:hypothetical protein